MRSEIYDLIPGGGPAFRPGLIGPNGKLAALCKGAKEPDPPPPVTAPVRADMETEGDAARSARRKKGIQSTILAGEAQPGLGSRTILGNPGNTPRYGGEP